MGTPQHPGDSGYGIHCLDQRAAGLGIFGMALSIAPALAPGPWWQHQRHVMVPQAPSRLSGLIPTRRVLHPRPWTLPVVVRASKVRGRHAHMWLGCLSAPWHFSTS